MAQLTGIDASFLYFESKRTPMHVAGLTLYDLPEGFKGSFYDHFRKFFETRVHLIPIFNKKLARTVFQLDHPGWVESGPLDFDYHIKGHVLKKPGSHEQLEALVAELHAQPLDRKKPLWEFTIIDGVANGPDGQRRAALYSKMHHAAIDGGAGMVITQALYDFSPDPRKVDPPVAKEMGRIPTIPERAILGIHDVVTNVVTQQMKAVEAIPRAMEQGLNLVAKLANVNPLDLGKQPISAPKTPFSITMGQGRSYAARKLSLAKAKEVQKATGTKLNDVVMAICAGALHVYLKDKKKLPKQPLIAFVPMSTREAGNTDMNNQVSGMNIPLATQKDDPIKRLMKIHSYSSDRKELASGVNQLMPTDYTFLGAPHLLTGLMKLYGDTQLADVLPQAVNVCISNTMGPPIPLYCAGAKVTAIYPVSIVTHGVGLNFTVQSYMGSLDFGLTGGRRAIPDIDVMGDLLEKSLDELHVAAMAMKPND